MAMTSWTSCPSWGNSSSVRRKILSRSDGDFIDQVMAKLSFFETSSARLVWIGRFKEIGDIAIQYVPVHAALPWAGVRFLLQVCRSSPLFHQAKVRPCFPPPLPSSLSPQSSFPAPDFTKPEHAYQPAYQTDAKSPASPRNFRTYAARS